MRRRWGLSREARGDGLVRFLLGFGGIRGEHGIGRERKERKKERGRGAGRGRRWAGVRDAAGPKLGLVAGSAGWLGPFSFFF